MPWTFSAALVLLLLLAPGALARGGKIIQLKQPIIGCTDKADLGQVPAELPKDISSWEMPLADWQGQCSLLSPGRGRIERVEGTYTCLEAPRHSCLWVRSEEIGVPIVGDSPDEFDQAAPFSLY
jgi:hypothetical protein